MKIGFIIMLILSINLILYAGGIRVFENEAFLDNFFDTSREDTLVLNDTFKDVVPNSFEESGSTSSVLSFIDGLKAVKDFALFIGNLIFTPIGIFLQPGMPFIVVLLVGLPLVVAGVVGIVLFIRGISG